MSSASIWPESEKLQIAVSSSLGSESQFTLLIVKYEFATPFTDGMRVNTDEEGLLALIQSGSLRDALYLTTKLLTNIGQGIGMRPTQVSPASLLIWSTRFQLMMALRLYAQLLDELAPFGELDAPDLYFQFHKKHADKKGSMVPYSLRLVHAEAPSFGATNPYHSITRIQKLEEETQKVIEMVQGQSEKEEQRGNPNGTPPPPELALWQERLGIARTLNARTLFRLNEYDKSFSAYERILTTMTGTCSVERRKHLLGNLLRMAMHVGDADRVERFFAELRELCGDDEEQFAHHSCSKSIFDGDYAQALATLSRWKAQRPEKDVADPATLANNEAICLLYNGRALESLHALFNHAGPTREALALNLGTIGDLVSTNSQALKQNYLAKHAQERKDAFDPESMKIL